MGRVPRMLSVLLYIELTNKWKLPYSLRGELSTEDSRKFEYTSTETTASPHTKGWRGMEQCDVCDRSTLNEQSQNTRCCVYESIARLATAPYIQRLGYVATVEYRLNDLSSDSRLLTRLPKNVYTISFKLKVKQINFVSILL